MVSTIIESWYLILYRSCGRVQLDSSCDLEDCREVTLLELRSLPVEDPSASFSSNLEPSCVTIGRLIWRRWPPGRVSLGAVKLGALGRGCRRARPPIIGISYVAVRNMYKKRSYTRSKSQGPMMRSAKKNWHGTDQHLLLSLHNSENSQKSSRPMSPELQETPAGSRTCPYCRMRC